VTPERWKQIEDLYHRARERPAADRAAFLIRACGADDALRREVESLLAQPVSADGASLLTGRRLGIYEILSPLGAGGMGEVYRARDTRLGREVAIKVLPREWAPDAERRARFEREARLLAALNHPNIATIHGFEIVDGMSMLVMELVEGDTLANWTGQPDLVVSIARQMADALEAAHEKNIIHRDLKPANIKITAGGVVKLLDFGLAKLAPGGESAGRIATASQTIAMAATREGLILGTAAYMSPEQARGQAVDKRTDMWAFGCVLYELLAGRAAFSRETITDTLAAVLEREPDWQALPQTTPPALRRLLRRCLEKDPRHRLRDIADARIELDEAAGPGVDETATDRDVNRRGISRWLWAAAALTIAAGVAALVWALSPRAGPTSASAVTRTTVTLPPDQELDTGNSAGPLAISPDGLHLAYVAHGGGHTQLYVRSLDAFAAKPIEETEGAQYPFFSPDSEWVAFFADRKLKRVSIRGGAPLTICDAAVIGRGGTWAPDGTIVFDPGAVGLMRVPAAGGRPEPLTSQDASIDASNLSWPHFLPDGTALIATIGLEGGENSTLAVLSTQTGRWRQLLPGSQAQYLPSGHLLYHAITVREGEIHAVPFDAKTLSLRGTPVAVVDSVFRAQNGGAAYYAVAQNGTLIFTPGGYARTLVRVDRHGRRTPLTDDHRGFRSPAISPDGLKVAVTIDPRPSKLWVYDIARRSGIPVATEGHNLSPVWTPDGRRVTYTSNSEIFWRPADASAPAERLLERRGAQYATSWSGDGRLLLFNDVQVGTNQADIWVLPLNEAPDSVIATAAVESGARLSPNGRWLAYQSDETGRLEVYVRPFPNVKDRKWTVSTFGGQRPEWVPNGRELFYETGSALMSVRVDTRGHAFVAGTPERLFDGPFDLPTTGYAISPDGNSVITVEIDPNARPTQVNVVLNWTDEVKRLTVGQRPRSVAAQITSAPLPR
jgi:serine/threonine-protein kinase